MYTFLITGTTQSEQVLLAVDATSEKEAIQAFINDLQNAGYTEIKVEKSEFIRVVSL